MYLQEIHLPLDAREWIVAPRAPRQKVRVIKGVAKNFIVPDDRYKRRGKKRSWE